MAGLAIIMGCGVSSGAVEYGKGSLVADMPMTEVFKTDTYHSDTLTSEIETELISLKKSTRILLTENERLKQELSRDISALFPQIFTAAESLDDLVEEWLLMDLHEGDNYMNFLEIVFPPASKIVENVRKISTGNKAKETGLKEFLGYFRYRYEQQAKILRLMGEEKTMVDECVKRVKTQLVAEIKKYETVFGKKSQEVDALTSIFARIQPKPCGEAFISGVQTFHEQTLAFHIAQYEAKLQAAAEAQAKLRKEHAKTLEEVNQTYQEQLREKDQYFESQKNRWEVLIRKYIDDIVTLSSSHRLDLDNQLLHFDAHCDSLHFQFLSEQQSLQSHLDMIINGLKHEIDGRDAIIRKRDETMFELESQIKLNLQEKVRLEDELEVWKKEVSELKDVIEEQKTELDYFEGHVSSKADMEESYVTLQSEVRRLVEAENSLREELKWAQEECRRREERIKELEGTMLKEEKRQKRMWAQTTTLRFMTRFGAKIRLEKAALLLVWNTIALTEPSPRHTTVSIPSAPYPHNVVDALSDDTFTTEQEHFASSLLQHRNETELQSSELREMYTLVSQKEKPMSNQQLFKTFEEMMARKYESDLADMKGDRLPKSVSSFLFEHLSRSVGLRPLAIKTLNQFVPALQQLYSEGHPYGLLICQFLQIFHETPISYLLGLYLTEAFSHFSPLTLKFSRIKTERSSKRGQKQVPILTPRMRKQMQLKPYLGGQAFLNDVMTLIYSLFEKDRNLGENIIKLLQPEDLSQEDFVTFLICQKMAKLGRTPESLFRLIDMDGNGFITETEFVRQIRDTLDLWLPEVSLRILYRNMTKKERNLSYENFISAVNFAAYTENCTNEDYSVSMCNFMLAIIQVFRENERKFAMFTKKTIENRKLTGLNWSDFQVILSILDGSLTAGDMLDLWTVTVQAFPESDRVTADQFVTVLLDYPVGKLREAVFCKG